MRIVIINLLDKFIIVGSLSKDLKKPLVMFKEITIIGIAHQLQLINPCIPFFLPKYYKREGVLLFNHGFHILLFDKVSDSCLEYKPIELIYRDDLN